MIHCCICKGTIKSGCICIATAREIFPEIEKSYSSDSSSKITFEDLKNLKYGDQIIIKDPLMGNGASYVLMSNVENKKYYFISGYGASLTIQDEDTIKGFHVRQIDNNHPSWNQTLSDNGKQMGKMLDEIADYPQL
ncbi:MAG: hypothetical protein ACTSWJ_02350 [Candidatus Heimdallarchaeaceae archaeon]